MGAVGSAILYPFVVAALTVWTWVIRDENSANPQPQIRMHFDTPSGIGTGMGSPSFLANANMTMTELDPVTGVGTWAIPGTDMIGTASGFHHFDLMGDGLKYDEGRHDWNPNGTFKGAVSEESRRRGVGLPEVGGTWMMISPLEYAEHVAAVQAMVAASS